MLAVNPLSVFQFEIVQKWCPLERKLGAVGSFFPLLYGVNSHRPGRKEKEKKLSLNLAKKVQEDFKFNNLYLEALIWP